MSDYALALPYRPISPWMELGAYEFLWTTGGQTFKRIADTLSSGNRPSDLVLPIVADECAKKAVSLLHQADVEDFGLRVHGMASYPQRLRDARYPVELLYFQGNWDLLELPAVAIVGTRNPSEEGKRRTAKLTKHLVEDGYAVVSGLAAGIDTVAHETAIACGGQTVAVIGTPLSQAYPDNNRDLQARIAREYLLVSQVPVIRHSQQDWRHNRAFFPQRNITMSALTRATVIVEASDTSGTLMQARAAIDQKRDLFILDSCFQNPSLEWPEKYLKEGAVRVKEYADIQSRIGKATPD